MNRYGQNKSQADQWIVDPFKVVIMSACISVSSERFVIFQTIQRNHLLFHNVTVDIH